MTVKHKLSMVTDLDPSAVKARVLAALAPRYYKIIKSTDNSVKFDCIDRERYNLKLFDKGEFALLDVDHQKTLTFKYVAIDSVEIGFICITLILAATIAYAEGSYAVFMLPSAFLFQALYRFYKLKSVANEMLKSITAT